jgi:hypothetical protein
MWSGMSIPLHARLLYNFMIRTSVHIDSLYGCSLSLSTVVHTSSGVVLYHPMYVLQCSNSFCPLIPSKIKIHLSIHLVTFFQLAYLVTTKSGFFQCNETRIFRRVVRQPYLQPSAVLPVSDSLIPFDMTEFSR